LLTGFEGQVHSRKFLFNQWFGEGGVAMAASRFVWREVGNAALTASAAEIRSLACPKCGAGLSVRFDPNSPQPDGSTAGFLILRCLGCSSGSALDNLDETPPWTEALGLQIKTQPGGAGPDAEPGAAADRGGM
jgi:hypothetical protein